MLFVIVMPLLLANASQNAEVHKLERLTLVMTGTLPAETTRKQYQEGTKSLLEIARELRNTEAFEQRLAHFFQEKLLITTPLNFTNLYVHNIKADGSSVNEMSRVHFKWRVVGGKRSVFAWPRDGEEDSFAWPQGVEKNISDLVAYYGNLLRAPADYHPFRPKERRVSRHLHFRQGHYVMKLFDTQALNSSNAEGYDVLKQKIADGASRSRQ